MSDCGVVVLQTRQYLNVLLSVFSLSLGLIYKALHYLTYKLLPESFRFAGFKTCRVRANLQHTTMNFTRGSKYIALLRAEDCS